MTRRTRIFLGIFVVYLAAVGLLAAMSGLLRPPAVTSTFIRLALILGPAVFLASDLGSWDQPRRGPGADRVTRSVHTPDVRVGLAVEIGDRGRFIGPAGS